MDVAAWLKSLGLGQFEAAFRDNEIDAEVLPHLTGDDLKELGVTSVGHRRKLLAAIAALAPPLSSEPTGLQPSPTPPKKDPETSAERRHLTVMFCDLVGSTTISAGLDAEDWRNLVSAYLDAASEAVTQMGGRVAKKLGDGLMALFGHPIAQENDSERAVRAALAIQRALAELNRENAGSGRPELVARIGVDSGAVVVDAAGEIFGDAPNIAARVQALAEPGAVMVTARVQRQVAGLFVAEDRGAHALKGAPEPTTLFRIVRASGGRRFGARALTPLVGREEELGIIARRWERARAGEGQLVLIVGEPGLGKSRLIEEFRARLGETPHTFVEWSSSQLLQNTPLHPIAEWGRQRFGGADTPAGQRLADLENTLQLIGLDPAEHAPLIAPLVDISLPPGREPALAPEEMRRRQLAAVVSWFLAGARSQPAALAFEDLHWADPTSIDLMRALAERGGQAPLLLLATSRPEFRPPWGLRAHHSVISLSPLARAEVSRMVGEIVGRSALSKDVIDGVNERTAGVPLFVEEVTRLLLERGQQGGAQAIPPTLQQSLAARLDRLGEAREVAQIGAVLGRDFGYALLGAVAELAENVLRAALDRLVDADLLFVEGAPPNVAYRFKHALIQDAAYDSLLKSRRQALHRRAAELLRDEPERAAAEPEVIAHHFTQAGLEDQAIEWWGKAGDQALRRSAFQEAIVHLGKAIELADRRTAASAPPAAAGVGSAAERLKLQTRYARAMTYSKGYGSEEAKAGYARAQELVEGVGDIDERFATLFGLVITSLVRGELRMSQEAAETFRRVAENCGRVMEAAVAYRFLGLTSSCQGDYIKAKAHLEEALRLYDPERDRETKFRFGLDTHFAATLYLAPVTLALGDIEGARKLIEESVARAVESGHIPDLLNAYMYKASHEVVLGDAEAALRATENYAEICQRRQVKPWSALALYSAWARTRLGDRKIGIAELRRAIAATLQKNEKLHIPFFEGQLAELEADEGDFEGALARIDEALALTRETGAHGSDAHGSDVFLHRLRGEILLKRDPDNPAPAEEAFLTAIDIAKQQHGRFHGLQAALKLAKLYQSTGRPAQAHAILAPALEGFAPTPEMPEIAEAQALLTALAESKEVKAQAAHRQRLHLQTAYGQAMMWSKGFAAEETKAALARIMEFAAKSDFAERFAVGHGQWVTAVTLGELRRARELASAFLKEAEDVGRVVEAGVARRGLAVACYRSGEFLEARTHCERALAACGPESEKETRERFTDDTGPVVMSVLAVTMWQLGEVERARELIDEVNQRARDLGHGPSMAHPLLWTSRLETLRGDAAAALSAAEALEALCREHGMPFWRVRAELHAGWPRGRLHDAAAGAESLRRALAAAADQGMLGDAWLYTALLAELETQTLGADSALERIDEALALARQVDNRCDLPFPHIMRGELLLKRDPSDPAAAEEAFRTALAIAREQGARSWGLRAALSLARLCQSTGRSADAYAVLAPALEGFSATPEMPEIAEAQTLLSRLA